MLDEVHASKRLVRRVRSAAGVAVRFHVSPVVCPASELCLRGCTCPGIGLMTVVEDGTGGVRVVGDVSGAVSGPEKLSNGRRAKKRLGLGAERREGNDRDIEDK